MIIMMNMFILIFILAFSHWMIMITINHIYYNPYPGFDSGEDHDDHDNNDDLHTFHLGYEQGNDDDDHIHSNHCISSTIRSCD